MREPMPTVVRLPGGGFPATPAAADSLPRLRRQILSPGLGLLLDLRCDSATNENLPNFKMGETDRQAIENNQKNKEAIFYPIVFLSAKKDVETQN